MKQIANYFRKHVCYRLCLFILLLGSCSQIPYHMDEQSGKSKCHVDRTSAQAEGVAHHDLDAQEPSPVEQSQQLEQQQQQPRCSINTIYNIEDEDDIYHYLPSSSSSDHAAIASTCVQFGVYVGGHMAQSESRRQSFDLTPVPDQATEGGRQGMWNCWNLCGLLSRWGWRW